MPARRSPARATRPSAGRAAQPAGGGRLSSRARLTLFLVAVFIVKLVVTLQLETHILLQPAATDDSAAYVGLAARVVAGDVGLGPGLYYVSPLYIYFLAVFTSVGVSLDGVRVVQIALGTIGVGVIFAIAREWFGLRAAWIAAGFAALTGLLTFYESILLQASLDPTLTAAALLFLTLGLRRGDGRWFLAAGVAFAILSLNRPNAIVAAAGIAALLVILRRWRPAVLLAAGIVAGVAPVGLRNVIVSHQWTLVSSHGGLNLYTGNNPDANGLFRAVPGVSPTIEGQARDTRIVAEAALKRPLTDNEVSAYFTDLALAWIREHPGAWIRLTLRKIGYLFNAQHIPLPLSYPFFAYDTGSILRFLFVGPWMLIPLGLVGLAAGVWPRGGSEATIDRASYLIWLSFVPLYALSVAMFFVSERYRLPLLVPLTVGAGAIVDRIVRDVEARRTSALVAIAAAIVVFGVACNWRLDMLDGDGRGEERVHYAENLARLGRADEATTWVARALESYPYTSLAHYRVGVELANTSQFDRAAVELREALRLDPNAPAVELALGQALANGGHAKEAIPHLQKAVADPSTAYVAGAELASALEDAGDRAGAVAVLRDLSTKAAGDVATSMQLARLASDLTAFDVAQAFLDRAVALAPGSAAIHEQSGQNLLALQRFDLAAAQFTDAVRLEPTRVDSLVRLAFAEFRLGRVTDAQKDLATALAIDPKNATGLQVQEMINKIRH